DWLNIFETIDKTDARIYLNIGDDGSHLFRDLLGQFHSIGPYILNNTYFYQSYYNASLNTAIAQLREQLQIVISMGEYFDHAYYGIAHTKEALGRGYPILLANPARLLSFDDKDVPIFIVGNGPSLDQSIQAIKEWQHKVIVISCGTALQALYRHGITPDFHAEIEQNRSTYDWAAMIGDLDYLKKITLISCNGIHPDTCELYKDVLIAFKEGESSTVSALSVLGQQNFEVLSHAFPTVSNFVTDLFCKIGFYNIYLIGVDLGFIDVKHHHSKHSGYYRDDGNETYDYAEKNNTSLVVPGNFRPTVNTKHEFKMSRQIIEQVTQKKHKEQTFYNCSDGAMILGTNPLNTDDLIIMAISEQKQDAIKKLYSDVFSASHSQDFVNRFESKFSIKLLNAELKVYEKLLDKEVTNFKQANDLINKQKELLFTSYKNGKSLLFYYLYGTVNYANAVLLKLLFNTTNKKQVPPAFNECITLWRSSLAEIKVYLQLANIHFDSSEYSKNDRENFVLSQHVNNKSLLIVTNSRSFANASLWVVKHQLTVIANVTISSFSHLAQSPSYDYIIYFSSQAIVQTLFRPALFGQINTLVIVDENAEKFPAAISEQVVTYISANEMMQNQNVYLNNAILANSAIRVCLNLQPGSVVVPRINMLKDSKTNFTPIYANSPITQNCTKALVFTYYSSLFENKIASKHFLGVNGSRGKLIPNLDNNIIYVYRQLDKDVMDYADQRYTKLIPNLYDDELFVGCLNKHNI
uniref:motility associated factor glycosyltransferase family protein n=1 Tax=Paraglaciecola sp. TaxID=1920173 RepID=UPI0030F46603